MIFPRTNTGNLSKKELHTDDSPLPFKQPSPAKTAAGSYPHRNLGTYLHAPKEIKRHNEKRAPRSTQRKFVPAVGDYRPAGSSRGNGKSKFVKPKPVAGLDQGQSDVNSEAIGSLLGPAALNKPPASFKTRKAKAKQMPFYGG